ESRTDSGSPSFSGATPGRRVESERTRMRTRVSGRARSMKQALVPAVAMASMAGTSTHDSHSLPGAATKGTPMCKTDSCRGLLSRRGAGAVLALALLVVLGGALLWAPSAEAQTQTSGAILLGPDCCQISHSPSQVGDSVGHPNDTVHIAVRIQSTSQIGGVFVNSTVVGTSTIILGCSSSGTTVSCTGAENSVLTFDSCAPEAGVASCAVDGGNSNHVKVTFAAGGKSVTTTPGGTLVATITAHFTALQEVLTGSTANGHLASEGQ